MKNRILVGAVALLAIMMLVGSSWPQGLSVSQAQTSLAEGVLFADNFDDGNADGWTISGDNAGWNVRDGHFGGRLEGRWRNSFASAGDPSWTDYVFEADVLAEAGVAKCLLFHYRDDNNNYGVVLRGLYAGRASVSLFKREAGVWTADIKEHLFPNGLNIWYHLKIALEGRRIRVWVNNVFCIDHVDQQTTLTSGKVALIIHTGEEGVDAVRFDNVEVRGLEPPVGLSVAYLDAVQVVDGQDIPLVKGKDTAIKVRVKNTGTTEAHNVRVSVTANGVGQGTVTRNRFYREERATQQTDFIFTGDPEDHLDVLNAGEEKTLYFFDDNGAFNPVGNENATSWYTVSATVTCDEGAADTEQLTKEVVATKWGSDQTLRLAYFPADWSRSGISESDSRDAVTQYVNEVRGNLSRIFPVEEQQMEFVPVHYNPEQSSKKYSGFPYCWPYPNPLITDKLCTFGLELWLSDLRQSLVLSLSDDVESYALIVPSDWFNHRTNFGSEDSRGIWAGKFPEFLVAEALNQSQFRVKPHGFNALHELGHCWGLGRPEVTDLIRVTEGLDVSRRRLMKDGGGHKVIDLMYGGMDPLGGQADRWIKPSDYRFLLDHQRVWVTQSALSPRFREGAGILVRAVISETNQTTLEPWFLLEGDFEYFLGVPDGSDFWLEYLDRGGIVIYRKGMGNLFVFMGEQLPYAPICFVAPYVEGMQSVVLKRGSQILAQRIISAHPPEISLTFPSEGAEINGSTTIRWQASDQDRNDLFFTLTAYQEGADQSIWPLASEISHTNEYVWDTQMVPEGWYRLRILVTDGFNTATAWTRVHVVHRIYLPLLLKVRQTQPPVPTATPTRTLTPTPTATPIPTATLAMGSATIWGRCLRDGNPLVGVEISIGSGDGSSTWEPKSRTNNEGYFHFFGVQVPPGGTTYGLWPTNHPYCRQSVHVNDRDYVGPLVFNFNASGQCY